MDWTTMGPETFDTDAAPLQLSLFAEPDACGTPDMFDAAAPALIQCPRCPSADLPAYAARHAARHATMDQHHEESMAADRALIAAMGPRRDA